ncbi:MAG: hypothetical protein IH624_02370 [Phycisphaerae bacterium]|nr:hypothetical protein [Phycisphaerae bacterium]
MFSSRISRRPLVLTLVAGLLCIQVLPVLAQETADNPLAFVPADCLFCVRINNFDGAMASVDKYAEGLAPVPVGLAMLARMPLAQIVGDPMLKNIRFDGDFVIFGAAAGTSEDVKKNAFVAVLLPVTDYESFLRDHPGASAPDDNGISKLSAGDDKPISLIRKMGSFALLAHKNYYDKVVAVSGSLDGGRSVADVLDRRRGRASAQAPIWAYGNVQRVGEVFGPTVYAGIDKTKAQLEKMSGENAGMASAGNVMDMYVEMFKLVFQEVDSVTWAIRPDGEVCRVATDLVPVKGGELEQILNSSSPPRGPIALLPYLGNGAMMNIGVKNDRPLLKRFYDDMFTVFKAISGGAIKQEDMDKLSKLTSESFDAFGDAVAFSMDAAADSQPPFAMKYFAQIKDAEAYKRVLHEEIQLMSAGAMNDLYKGMGLDMKFAAKRNAATYKDVQIDSATLSFEAPEGESDMHEAVSAMYGDGLDYRWAIVDDLMVYAISGDVEKDIRALIDQVKSPRPEEPASEMAQALSYLRNARSAHAVGTVNLVRCMQMGMGMAGKMGGAGVPKVDVATESNLAFAARVRNGRISADYALPKKHLMEVKAAVEQINGQTEH